LLQFRELLAGTGLLNLEYLLLGFLDQLVGAARLVVAGLDDFGRSGDELTLHRFLED
jgi:hypothetical protein